MKNKTTYNRTMHDKRHPYTMISAELLNNEELTGEERFLLIYLLGRSDDFVLNSSYYADESKKLFGWTREKFYKFWMSLQKKGYIEKSGIRDNGKFKGAHYTVNELHPDSLKNRNTVNPKSGKSAIGKTRTLLNNDKPNIDKLNNDTPNRTNTNQSGVSVSQSALKVGKKKTIKSNEQVDELFNLIVDLNPDEQSSDWSLNKKDEKLIMKAIKLLGFESTRELITKTIVKSTREYCSVSYVFSEFKEDFNVYQYLKEHPEHATVVSNGAFHEETVEKAMEEASPEFMFDFIKKEVVMYYNGAKNWKASQEDIDNCETIVDYGEKINLNEKLVDGLKSAIKKDKWNFTQIIYQAIAAIDNYDENYGL